METVEEVKVCTKCSQAKSLSEFIRRSGPRGQQEGLAGRRAWCTSCYCDYNREYRHTRPNVQEAARQNAKNWAKKNPDKVRNQSLVKKFGVTLEERDEMLKQQGGKCANRKCGATDPGRYQSKGREGRPRDWHVDHCHKTNKIRGVLCPNCNLALGFVQDDTDRLQGLIEYLQKSPFDRIVKGEREWRKTKEHQLATQNYKAS
jgi:hypothetical protein